MARKAGKNGKSSTPEATTLLLPGEKKLEDLLRLGRNTKKRAQSAAGEFGDAVGKAVENGHLDRKAFAIVRGLDALDDERLHVTYYHLLDYMEKLGVVKRATAQSEMFEGRKDGEAGDAEEADDGKVTSIGKAARKVAEQAGANAS